MEKIKIMRCHVSSGQVEESAEYPCDVCRNECVKDGMKRHGLVKDDAHDLDLWSSLTTGNRSTLPRFIDCVVVT